MDRRTFNYLLIAVPFAIHLLARASLYPKSQTTVLQISLVAGFQYYRGEAIWLSLQMNNVFALRTEKTWSWWCDAPKGWEDVVKATNALLRAARLNDRVRIIRCVM